MVPPSDGILPLQEQDTEEGLLALLTKQSSESTAFAGRLPGVEPSSVTH